MRVKNFNDPVSMADGTLKTLAGMGGGDSGGGSGTVPVAGLTVERFNKDALPKTLEHDGILFCQEINGTEDRTQLQVIVPGVKTYRVYMTKDVTFICPVTKGTQVQFNGDDWYHNIFLYYH